MAKKSATTTDTTTTPIWGKNTLISLTIAKQDVAAAKQQATAQLARRVRTDGFRKGKVPAGLAERILNPQDVIEQTLQTVVPTALSTKLQADKISFLGRPEITKVETPNDADWQVEIALATPPEVKLPNLKKVVAEAIKKLAADDKEKQKDNDKKKLVSKSTPDEKDIKEKETAEQLKNKQVQAILAELVETTEVLVPELLISQDVAEQLHSLTHQLEHMQISLDQYLQSRQQTREQLAGELAARSTAGYKLEFATQEIAEQEKLQPTTKDLEVYLEEIKSQTTLEKLSNESREHLTRVVQRQKVHDFLLSLAK